MEKTGWSGILAAAALLLAGGCTTKTPNRDHIPELRQQLYRLQQGIAERNRAAIDSVLSVQILDEGENSDSLLSFVYGPNGDLPFQQLGNYDIFYTEEKARIDCALMDSLGNYNREVTFTLVREHGMWLFKRFEPKQADTTVSDE